MSELKSGWLDRQFKEMHKPYTNEEYSALCWSSDEGEGPYPSVFRLRGTIDQLRAELTQTKAELQRASESYRTKEPCGHYANFQMGDTHGNFVCAVCEIDRICGEYNRVEAELQQANKAADELAFALQAEYERRDAEIVRVRKALEDAPHEANCLSSLMYFRDRCDCWKSSALSQQPPEEK